MRQVIAAMLAAASILGSAAAADRQQAYLAAGIGYPNNDVRNLTSDIGYYAAFGYMDRANTGAFGAAAVDLELRTISGRGNRLDSFNVCYSERALLTQEGVYFGLGLGSWYHRLRDNERDENGRRWRPGAKAMLGIEFKGDLFIEAAYHYSGEIRGLDTAGFTAALGLRF